jgi:hypothetical protein
MPHELDRQLEEFVTLRTSLALAGGGRPHDCRGDGGATSCWSGRNSSGGDLFR